MGSSSSKPENDYASLFVNIKEPEHFAGQMVQGQVEILVKKKLAVNNLDLVLKGKEKTHWTKRVRSGKHTHTRHYNGKRVILEHRIPLVTYSGNVLDKGYHKIQFHFELPKQIPGSFVYYVHNTYAKVQYQVNAELQATDKDKSLKFKRVLLVSQKMFPQLENRELSDERNVKSFGCFSKGLSKIKARFEQNSFHVNQTARTLFSIDNTDCKAKVDEVKIRLRQKIIMASNSGAHKQLAITVAKEKFPGIGKNEKTPHGEWRFLELNLYKFVKNYLAEQGSYQRDVKKHYGEFFLQPSTHTKLIDCRYFVEIIPKYDVICECCSGGPKISLPINLGVPQNQEIPAYYPSPQIFSQPFEGESHEHVAQPIDLIYQPEQNMQFIDTDTTEPLLSKEV